jgi:protein-disulfide isomerase
LRWCGSLPRPCATRQCPFSKKAHFKLKEVVEHYGKDKLDVVFINWIQPWHPQATWLHSAVLAASLFDDKSLFWKLTDLLYEKQDECKPIGPPARAHATHY